MIHHTTIRDTDPQLSRPHDVSGLATLGRLTLGGCLRSEGCRLNSTPIPLGIGKVLFSMNISGT